MTTENKTMQTTESAIAVEPVLGTVICEHDNCKRKATISNQLYFNGKWYCTYHANKATKEGRRKRKYGSR